MGGEAAAATVLVMAGGTGGHVFPALAVAERLRAGGVEVAWLGSRAGMEARIASAHGFAFHGVAISGLRGRGVASWLAAPWRIGRAVAEARRVLRAVRPSVVLGMGGYAAGPGGIAAWLTRTPLVIHEQNAIPGLTNRLLSRLAGRVLEGFPGSFPRRARALYTGNPVRPEIAALAPPPSRAADAGAGAMRLLVLGGSQGARALNEVVPATLAVLGPRLRLEVRHQAGERNVEATTLCYRCHGLAVTPLAFIDDMAASYAWADLVLCRAGAMTVCELATAGVASVLVPFPFAVDDHQAANARFLSDAGAAVLLPEPELAPDRLSALLLELSAARERLRAMAVAARRLAVLDADRRVARVCLEVAHA
jgi:UDP-N-acetylglucosamine--N-acetylmuramyl-(pentapeptide) pyrophosphoryl-undecaprenol N-acetylglucosamine transferase